MEFVPGYRAANAPQRETRSENVDLPQFPQAAAKSKDGNGHGPRTSPDDAKPFAYSESEQKTASALRLNAEVQALAPGGVTNLRLAVVADPLSQQGSGLQTDAPACDVCGSITVRSGTCYKCLNCGNSMGYNRRCCR